MRRPLAIAGSAVFFILAPGVVAGVVPWLLTQRYGRPFSSLAGAVPLGLLLVVAGVAVLLHAFARFALEGAGTPAPVTPTERLVVGGPYRYVRNPMYVAVLAIILGQALLFASWAVALYAVAAWAATFAFVHFYEEPTLARRYGDQYEAYRRAVRSWVPRLTPWRGT